MATKPRGRFGVWLVETLHAKRLSAAEVSRRSGIRESLLSRWRTGRELPTEERRQALAAALGVDPETIPIPTDTERADFAHYFSEGHLPNPAVSDTSDLSRQQPQYAGGRQEVGRMGERVIRLGTFGERLTDDDFEHLTAQVMQWIAGLPAKRGRGSPQLAAGRSESRRRRPRK